MNRHSFVALLLFDSISNNQTPVIMWLGLILLITAAVFVAYAVRLNRKQDLTGKTGLFFVTMIAPFNI
jgi:hypothetical protein